MSVRGKPIEIKEDTSQPIECTTIFDGGTRITQESAETYNRFVLTDRESHGRRTRLKVTFEVWARGKYRTEYKRLRQLGAVLNCPSSDQAHLAIKLVTEVCRSLDGKLLAPADSGTSPRG